MAFAILQFNANADDVADQSRGGLGLVDLRQFNPARSSQMFDVDDVDRTRAQMRLEQFDCCR